MRIRIRTTLFVLPLVAATVLFLGTPGAGATQGAAVVAGMQNTEAFETLIVNTKQVSLQDCVNVNASLDSGLVGCGFFGLQGLGNLIEGVGVTGRGYAGVEGDGVFIGVNGSGANTGVLGSGGTAGVHGQATGGGNGKGVYGTSATGDGVFGQNSGSTGTGVHGLTPGTGSGVFGQATANGIGVFGTSASATGVFGQGSTNGVEGETASGTGVYGHASSGTGVRAYSDGVALQVQGKAKFSRSGIATIPATKASTTISLAGVTTSSMVIATAQQSLSVYVKAAVPASGSFKVFLTGNAPSGGLKVAYFVLN